MTLPDYYKILEVHSTASSAEIKAAYRRLAKIYHPDKSSAYADEEKFKQIKEAYETLINPQRRSRYDAKRNRATTFGSATSPLEKKPHKKNYSFSEEEARRRQYYQQHYKAASSQGTRGKVPPEPATPQSELKYILISVPVAVALLLLIIRIYERPAPQRMVPIHEDTLLIMSEINTGEIPYKGTFGRSASDSSTRQVLKLVNRSGYDAVVFLVNDSQKVQRHHFLAHNYELYIEDLPSSSYQLHYWLGRGFSYKNFLFDTVMGNFTKTVCIDSLGGRIKIRENLMDSVTLRLENTGRQDTFILKRLFFDP